MLQGLINQQLVIALRNGVFIEGKLIEYRGGWLRLVDVIVTGKHHRIKTDWLLIDRNQICHLHPPGQEVVPEIGGARLGTGPVPAHLDTRDY